MESRNKKLIDNSISKKWRLFDMLYSFGFGKKIKMDFTIFLIFAILTNYCFIVGCTSEETTAKVSVNNNIDGSSTTAKTVEISEPLEPSELSNNSFDSTLNFGPEYQVPVVYPYPYPYPVAGVYYSPNSGGFDYETNPHFIETIPQVPPVIPVPGSASVHTEPYVPYQPANIPTVSQDQNVQTVLANPLATPTQPVKRQDIIGGAVRDPYYQPSYGRPPQPVPQYNPCQYKQCRPGARCVVRRNPNCPSCQPFTVCVNPCETVRCASGYICKTEVGYCGTSFCEPRAICVNPCQGVVCPGNESCTLVSLPCTTNCDPVPICGRDPCETKQCPPGQGCYLQEMFCSRPPCKVEAVCRDPCATVLCEPGEFCYTEEVTCIKAPCNPIPYCKNPCASVTCPAGQHCELEQVVCVRAPCYPVATCKPN